MMHLKNKKTFLIVLGAFIISSVITIIAGYSFSVGTNIPIELMEANDEYVYHIDVSFDNIGICDFGVCEYPDADIIHVEDKLPEGLTFKRFSQENQRYVNGTDDNGYECGYVVNGVNGLHYDEDTRIVSYDIENLRSSCTLRIGIVVSANETINRVDFYNTAKIFFRNEQKYSNTVHTYIGSNEVERYNVSYVINGVNKDVSNITPISKQYAVGQTVDFDIVPEIFGYEFDSYSSNDVTITNNKFVMPNKDVVINLNYTDLHIEKHKVKYIVDGKGPKDLLLPTVKEYYPDETVYFDDSFLSKENSDEEYYFSDIMFPTDLIFNDNGDGFIMPNKDVTIALFFEKKPYIITYDFLGNIIPKNIELPSSTANVSENVIGRIYDMYDIMYDNYQDRTKYGLSTHYLNDRVNINKEYKSTLCEDKSTGFTVKCRFLGWLYNDEFNMPSHTINIYGTWMKINGTFEPEITVEVLNKKDYYEKNDVVEFKTTITNNSDVDIKNLMIKNYFEGQNFNNSENYTVEDNIINISELKADGSIEILSTYKVTENVNRNFVNELQIVNAEAENEYYLENNEYKASADFSSKMVGDNSDNPVPNTPNETQTNETNQTNDTNSTTPKESTVPKTLDNAYIYIGLFVLSLLLIICIVFVLIKNKKNEK